MRRDGRFHCGLKGTITIGRVYGDVGERCISIRVRDDLSQAEFVAINLSLEEFSNAIFGGGFTACEFTLRPQVVGLKVEHKTEMVEIKDGGDETIEKALCRYEVDGWKARRDDVRNHHNRSDGKYRVSFIRYVNP